MVQLGPDDGRFVWPNHVLEYAVFVWESSDCWIVFINCLSTSKLQSSDFFSFVYLIDAAMT